MRTSLPLHRRQTRHQVRRRLFLVHIDPRIQSRGLSERRKKMRTWNARLRRHWQRRSPVKWHQARRTAAIWPPTRTVQAVYLELGTATTQDQRMEVFLPHPHPILPYTGEKILPRCCRQSKWKKTTPTLPRRSALLWLRHRLCPQHRSPSNPISTTAIKRARHMYHKHRFRLLCHPMS